MDHEKWFIEAVIEVDYRCKRLMEATTAFEQAEALVRLRDAVGDVRTYLPGYDYETDTLPWEREDM